MIKVFTYQGNLKQTSSGGLFACSLLSTCTTDNLAEGSNLYFTDSRAVTALTGENISIFTNDSGYLTSLSGAVLTTRSLTINGVSFDLSADRTWTISTVTGNAGTATALQTARRINSVLFDGTSDINTDEKILTYQALGSTILSQNVNGGLGDATGTYTMADNRVCFMATYLKKAGTITGIKWKQATQGSYTADGYNGVGLYTYSGGTLTLVASSTDDGNIWKATTGTISSKAFSSTYAASAGLHFIGVLYCNSSQSTAPVIGAILGATGTNIVNDFTNSAKLNGHVVGQTSLPASIAMSSITAFFNEPWAATY